MEIAKCSFCLKEVSEIGKTYYEAWEKKKSDFGMGIKEKIFCQNCWKEQEKNYRNWPCDTGEIKRRITEEEISEKTSTGYTIFGDWICYDPVKRSWVKEGEQTPTNPENKPVGKKNKNNDFWIIIWVVLIVLLLTLIFFLIFSVCNKKKRGRI